MRSLDLIITQNVDYKGFSIRKIDLSLSPSKAIEGVQKIIQRFIVILLTIKESIRNDPEFGTNFLLEITQNNLPATIENVFAVASQDAIEQLIKYTEIDDPTLLSAEIIDYVIVNNSVLNLNIKLNFENLNPIDIQLPVELIK